MIDQNDEICRICKAWGVGYVGSKNKHIKWLFSNLPAGQRFVDLFGGGFAASHYAVESGKYPIVIYSDINHQIVSLIQRAASGDFDIGRFKPKWYSRNEFFSLKGSDPFVKYIFSYGNGGKYYLGQETSEFFKRWYAFYEFLYNSNISDYFIEIMARPLNEIQEYNNKSFVEKYLYSTGYCRSHSGKNGIHTDIFRLIKAGRAARKCVVMQRDYKAYEYKKGDIVYCDIPYIMRRGTKHYELKFNHDEFYEWARKTPCFISEFQAPDDFVLIDSKEVKSSLGLGYNKQSNECLFASPAAIREGVYNAHKQLCFNWVRDSIGDTQRGLGVDDMA